MPSFTLEFVARGSVHVTVEAETAAEARDKGWQEFKEEHLPSVDPWDLFDVGRECPICEEPFDPDDIECPSCAEDEEED